MFTMVNALNKKQIQYNQELKEIETKNSDKEIQFVYPQIRARFLDDLMFSLCLQKCKYCVPAKLTTLNMLRLYSKWLRDVSKLVSPDKEKRAN